MEKGSQKGREKGRKKGAPARGFTVALFYGNTDWTASVVCPGSHNFGILPRTVYRPEKNKLSL
jgi:hypothetical protein